MVTKIFIKGSNQASADGPRDGPRPRVYFLPPVMPLSSSKIWTPNSPGSIDFGFDFIFKEKSVLDKILKIFEIFSNSFADSKFEIFINPR